MGDEVPSAWNSELAEASWLIVPLYNEGQVIRSVMQEARRTFPNIVCVDDGSRDNSAQEALAAGVHVVQHPINLGQGAALRTGLDYALAQAGSRYFVTFDSDGQHRVVDAQRMVCRFSRCRHRFPLPGYADQDRVVEAGDPSLCGMVRTHAHRNAPVRCP